MPALDSLTQGALPIGLASDVRVTRPVRKGEVLGWKDVTTDQQDPAVVLRREMERSFTK